MLAIPPGWNHTVPYPGRSSWRSVVVIPPVDKIASDLLYFLYVLQETYVQEHVHGRLVAKEDIGGFDVTHLLTQRVLLFNRSTCCHLTEHQATIVGVVPPVFPDCQIN